MYPQVLFKNRRPDRIATLEEYRAGGGYQALAEVVTRRSRQEVQEIVLDAALLGRGGAAFPAGRKMMTIAADAPFPRYLVCNADEMEPGTFKDRVLIHADPHMLIEGIAITAWAVRAEKAVIFIRPEYENAARILEREIRIAAAAGYLGRGILGSDYGLEVVVHRSAGRYICGEVIHLRRGDRPAERPDGPPTQPQAAAALCHGKGAVAPADPGPQRRDPGLPAPHRAQRGRVVQEPRPDPDRRRHQDFRHQRQGQAAGVLRAAHRRPVERNRGGMRGRHARRLGIQGMPARRRLDRLPAPAALPHRDGLRRPEESRQPPGHGRHHGLRPQDLPGGGHLEPDGILRARVLRVVHALPGGPALHSRSTGAHRGRRRGTGIPSHAGGNEGPPLPFLLRLRPGGGRSAGEPARAFQGRGPGAHPGEKMPVQERTGARGRSAAPAPVHRPPR